MARPASGNLKAPSTPVLKNPLRASTMPLLDSAASSSDAADGSGLTAPRATEVSAEQLRKMQISEFSAWLRAQTSKHKRPFQEETIRGYAETARALDLWMAEREIDGDFTACDVVVLNQFFADYRYEHPDPWSGDLVRYGPVKSRPSTLAEEFIREELAQQQVTDLSEDLISRPFVRVVPLKGAREFSEGRLVPLMMTSAQALAAYLRTRRAHKMARRLMGWQDRSMVDRYAADMQDQRAFEAKRRRGDMY